MVLHLRCSKCKFLDLVLEKNAKNWKCPNCELNQPERSKREDQDKHKNCNVDYLEILCDECYQQFFPGCGALNSMET